MKVCGGGLGLTEPASPFRVPFWGARRTKSRLFHLHKRRPGWPVCLFQLARKWSHSWTMLQLFVYLEQHFVSMATGASWSDKRPVAKLSHPPEHTPPDPQAKKVWVRCFEEDHQQLTFCFSRFCLFCILPLPLIFPVLPKAASSSEASLGHWQSSLQTLKAVFWSEPSRSI